MHQEQMDQRYKFEVLYNKQGNNCGQGRRQKNFQVRGKGGATEKKTEKIALILSLDLPHLYH